MYTVNMTPKQVLFVQEYLVDLNATQAAIRAGYSMKTAYSQGQRMLKNVEVQQAISEEQERRSRRVGRNADDVLFAIQDVTRKALENGDLRTALRGLELEGRHYGMFKDRVQSGIAGKITIGWRQ